MLINIFPYFTFNNHLKFILLTRVILKLSKTILLFQPQINSLHLHFIILQTGGMKN